MIGNKLALGHKLSESHKQAIIKANTGVIFSEETKAKLREKAKLRGNNGNRNRNKGGVSKSEYKEKLAGRKKPESCEICGKVSRICFDHCHVTGKFRGWICFKCNIIIGLSDEVPEILEKLAEYIRKNS